MAANREDLRDHLTAVISAAQELPTEDRPYLADTFLDELESQFQLVPRSQDAQPAESAAPRPRFANFFSGRGTPPIGVMVLLSVLLLPLLLMSFFVLVHPPVFLLGLVVLLYFRFGRPGMRRQRPRSHGSRHGDMSHYSH